MQSVVVSPNCYKFFWADAQSPNDGVFVSRGDPAFVRPLSEDWQWETVEEDGKLYAVPVVGEPNPSAQAGSVSYQGPWHLCNACLSALGYLVHYWNEVDAYNAAHDDYEEKENDPENPRKRTSAAVHHWNLDALEKAACRGCHLCRIIAVRCRTEINEAIVQGAKFSNFPRFELLLNRSPGAVGSSGEALDGGDLRLISAMSFATPEDQPWSNNYFNVLRMQMWREEEVRGILPLEQQRSDLVKDPLLEFNGQQVPPRGLLSGNTKASRPATVAWLNECISNIDGKHDACNSVKSSWLPTRLLYLSSIESNQKVRIISKEAVETMEERDVRYISLSHCWGTWGAQAENLPQLLASNITAMQEDGIEYTLLPQTFRDAVDIAGWYGVKHLWIDSMCIIQDSAQDWLAEASKMADVYKHALLNISADASADGRGGCFKARDPAGYHPFQLRFQGQADSWWLTVDERNTFGWMEAGRDDSPLVSRAWVYQERHLSRRLLHYTASEVFWECLADTPSFRSETWLQGSPFKRDFKGQSKVRPAWTNKNSLKKTVETNQALRETWDKISRDFCTRRLTYATDKLPALSGLAREFGAACPEDVYVAGLWKSSFPRNLLWNIDQLTLEPELSRPSTSHSNLEFIAPTFSWLSQGNEILNIHDVLGDLHGLLNVKDISLMLRDSDPYGRLNSAALTVEGLVRKIICKRGASKFEGFAHQIYNEIGRAGTGEVFVDHGVDRRVCAGFHIGMHPPAFMERLDRYAEEEEEREFQCLLAAVSVTQVTPRCYKRTVHGLLLEPVPGREDCFTRAGTIVFHEGNCALNIRYNIGENVDTRARDYVPSPEDNKTEESDVVPLGQTKPTKENEENASENEGSKAPPMMSKFWKHVAPYWGHNMYSEPREIERFDFQKSGPLSIYELDGDVEEPGFERLEPRTVTII